MMQPLPIKLSICIATYNRATFIGATLEGIIAQMTADCEIVVSDNASTDNTEQVVSKYARHFDRLRYFRQDTNKGFDRNFNSAVELARGEYCWLMPDDDLLKPGAVARVLEAIHQDLSLIMLNVEVRDVSMSKVLQRSWLDFKTDRIYRPAEIDRLFVEVSASRAYIGNIILKRTIWLSRKKEPYYDSLYIHVGMIFQEHLPGTTLVIAEPLMIYRLGNSVNSYSSKEIEISFDKWPSLVKSLAISESVKKTTESAEPWRHPQYLLLLRGWGFYSLTEYRQWIQPRLNSIHEKLAAIFIALLPGILINTLFVSYYSIRTDRGHYLHFMRQSRFHLRNWRASKRNS